MSQQNADPDREFVLKVIRLTRPRAKFVSYAHSDEFDPPNEGDVYRYHYVNLYDEKIDANVIESSHGRILIQNTYLSSFAYNLLLSWMYQNRNGEGKGRLDGSDMLLRHNFKKFFAEQLYHFRNTAFSRAILLETLLYEQEQMIPVFSAKEKDEGLRAFVNLGASIMSLVVSLHELAHISLDHGEDEWSHVYREHETVIGDVMAGVRSKYPPPFVEEVRCDVMAVYMTLHQYVEEAGRLQCLRLLVFAYAAFAVLTSLTKSARATLHSADFEDARVDFSSIEKRSDDTVYRIGIDADMRERARIVVTICEGIAAEEGLSLYSTDPDFPLPEGIVDGLLAFVDSAMETDDDNARRMALLVAQALQDHPDGMEWLYLRSKTFVRPGSHGDQPLTDRDLDGDLPPSP